MQHTIQPLTLEQDAKVRKRIAENPFISFMEIEVSELGLGYAKFVLPFRKSFANAIGLLQGGVIAAIADEAVAYALWSLVPDGEIISTVEYKINFLAPVRQGPIEAQACIVRRGKTISLGEVAVMNQCLLVAKGLFTYIHIKPH